MVYPAFIPWFIGVQPSFWWCRISSIHNRSWGSWLKRPASNLFDSFKICRARFAMRIDRKPKHTSKIEIYYIIIDCMIRLVRENPQRVEFRCFMLDFVSVSNGSQYVMSQCCAPFISLASTHCLWQMRSSHCNIRRQDDFAQWGSNN